METFWLCFVPLFVAVDAIGVLPMYMSLTEGVDDARRPKLLFQSLLTALTVALGFLGAGRAILRLLGISIADFMIAGGVLLFVLSLSDMLSQDKRQRRVDPDNLGAVPIGVPLIVGPAVLTTGILLVDQYGYVVTAIAAALNILIGGGVFWLATPISRLLGVAGSKILSKIASLLLASIAVMIVRRGVMQLLGA